MKIGVAGSMQFTEKLLETKETLEKMGHSAFISELFQDFLGKNDEEKEVVKLHQKYNKDAMRSFWDQMQGADAILVLNYDKKGIKNYIGGNTFLEMGWAYVLKQKIFLLNPMPEGLIYDTEIIAMNPIILDGDLSKIK